MHLLVLTLIHQRSVVLKQIVVPVIVVAGITIRASLIDSSSYHPIRGLTSAPWKYRLAAVSFSSLYTQAPVRIGLSRTYYIELHFHLVMS